MVWPGLIEIDEQVLAAKFEALLLHLDERTPSAGLGAEAHWLGRNCLSLLMQRLFRSDRGGEQPQGWCQGSR